MPKMKRNGIASHGEIRYKPELLCCTMNMVYIICVNNTYPPGLGITERSRIGTATTAIEQAARNPADVTFPPLSRPRPVPRVNLGTAVEVRSPCPRLHIAVAVVINTTGRGETRTWVLSWYGMVYGKCRFI